MKLRNLKQQIGLRSSVWNVMDSGHRNKRNKRFHLNLLKNRKSIRWGWGGGLWVLNVPKNSFNTFLTIHSTINVESILHEAPTTTKDEIDINPPTKIKLKSNLNDHTDEIPRESENQSQLIDEQCQSC